MQKVQRQISQLIFTNYVLIFISLTPIFFDIFLAIMFHYILLLIGVIYALIIFSPLKELYQDTLAKRKIRGVLLYDLQKAIELVEYEMDNLFDILSYSKTETDVHSFNATNEGKVMSYNMSTVKGYKNRLGQYQNIHKELVKLKDIN